MGIDASEVRRIARLAGLEARDEEVERSREDLASILRYVAMLAELDAVADVAGRGPGPTRADEVREPVPAAAALRAAPDAAHGMFRVPRVLPE